MSVFVHRVRHPPPATTPVNCSGLLFSRVRRNNETSRSNWAQQVQHFWLGYNLCIHVLQAALLSLLMIPELDGPARGWICMKRRQGKLPNFSFFSLLPFDVRGKFTRSSLSKYHTSPPPGPPLLQPKAKPSCSSAESAQGLRSKMEPRQALDRHEPAHWRGVDRRILLVLL